MLRGATFYAGRFLTGEKSALLAFAVGADRCQIAPDDPWLTRDQVAHGQAVHQVKHSGLYTSTAGGRCSIRALPGRDRLELEITEIRMVDCAQLTDDQIAALGMTRDEFETLYGHQMHGVRGWLIYAIPITPNGARQ